MSRLFASLIAAVALFVLPAQGGAQNAAQASEQYAIISSLTVAQARQLGARAIQGGRPDIALALADHILRLAPEDSFGHFLQAQAFLQAGQPENAVRPGQRSFRYAQTDTQKFQAARTVAMAQTGREQYLPAQLWMRRALQNAPDEASRAQAAREFKGVRRASKLSLSFGLAVSPSNNVNNGATERTFRVEGIPFVGFLSEDAQALDGLITRTSLSFGYRLHSSDKSLTQLRGSLLVQGVQLSGDAQDRVPGVDARSYGYTLAEIGLNHRQAIVERGPILSFSAFVGRAWFGGNHSYDSQRADLSIIQPLWTGAHARLGYGRQVQMDAEGEAKDVVTATWRIGLSQRFGNGDEMGFLLFEGQTDADNSRRDRVRRGATLYYDRGTPVGPFDLAASVSAQESHYAQYPWLFGIRVPGGRWDTRLSATVDVALPDLNYLGFMPTVSVTRETTASNVSRFETQATSVSIGFRSQF